MVTFSSQVKPLLRRRNRKCVWRKYNYIPDDCIKTVMLPLVKESAGKIADTRNYRPISLTTSVSKLIELIILNRYENILISSDNQLGFKKNLSTDMFIFSFKQTVYYYVSKSSPV